MNKNGNQSANPAAPTPQTFPVILASNSPRRKELLRLTGLDYQVAPADVDETPHPGEPAAPYVLRTAEEKARAAAQAVATSQNKGGEWIIAADTTVADGDQILGKPQDAEEAFAMLAQLRGREHQVYTAVAVYRLDTRQLKTALATTNVPMREYTDKEIHAYIATGDPYDKAGSYAIQHSGFHPVETLTGCYANV
ncbi:MAG: Maf family protein, partial [Anaerolineales bacterium]